MKIFTAALIGLTLLAVVQATVQAAVPATDYAAQAAIRPGDLRPLPPIRWQDADDHTHSLADTQGRARILHFWAAWCVPCRRELPALLRWQTAHPEIEIVVLSVDRRLAQARHFLHKYRLPLPPLLLHPDDHALLSLPALPYTLFLSRDGLVLGYQLGPAPWETEAFTRAVQTLLETDPGQQR
ncbi:MAG: TlpA disulfide reductase family protein [Gammaproteobacteria bacterium]|nr:TlpA disulfide reductase family protein [Gammaproteobacteria bacterium]